jgi:hypothetical protein
MERIAILTPDNRTIGGFNFFFPLYRWESLLHDNQFHFYHFSDHKNQKLYNFQIIIINSRYFQNLLNQGIYKNNDQVMDFLQKLKNKGIKIIFLDAADSTGSRFFDLISIVDLFLKKQLLKDKEKYLLNEGDKSVRIWINEYDQNSVKQYQPCRIEHLHKLKLAWNIGLVDFRYNPFKLGIISNHFFSKPRIKTPSLDREILTSFRGGINKNNSYSFQRNLLIKHLMESKNKVITGKPINRIKYLIELGNCKAIVSPYGWGEICYRDFETFLKGAVLIKPDLSHLMTFPDFFLPNQTYIPINWQMTDLEEKLNLVNDKYNELIEIAIQGQNNFLNAYNNGELFVNHLKEIISEVI